MVMRNRPAIGILEVDYSVPIGIREKLNFHTTEIDFLVNDLKGEEVLDECFFTCTCNRTLLVYVCKQHQFDVVKRIVASLFNKWAKVSIPMEYLNFYGGEEALNKLLRLSVGADSAILGEDQILGQIKMFYKVALKNKLSGPILNRIIQNLLFATRKIKMEYPISRGRVSIPGIVIEEIKKTNLFKQKPLVKVLIVGWGEITYTIFKILDSSRDKYIVSVSNRTLSKVNVAVNKIDVSKIRGVSKDFNIIISMASRLGYVITKSDLADNGDNYLIFDLGVPRNIDPEISNLKNVELFDIDDINQKSDISIEKRKETLNLLSGSKDFLFFQKKMTKFIDSYQSFSKKYKIIKKKMEALEKEKDLLEVTNKNERKVYNSMNKRLYREVFNS